MATKLNNHTFTSKRGGKGGSKYPWAEWLDGSVWGLVAGVDFTCKHGGVKFAAKKAAKAIGKKLRWELGKDQETGHEMLIIQAVPLPPATPAPAVTETPPDEQPKAPATDAAVQSAATPPARPLTKAEKKAMQNKLAH